MRIYFHLKDAHHVLPDDNGVEVSGPEEVRDQALRVVEELREKDARHWSGWSLVAADAARRSSAWSYCWSLGRPFSGRLQQREERAIPSRLPAHPAGKST